MFFVKTNNMDHCVFAEDGLSRYWTGAGRLINRESSYAGGAYAAGSWTRSAKKAAQIESKIEAEAIASAFDRDRNSTGRYYVVAVADDISENKEIRELIGQEYPSVGENVLATPLDVLSRLY